ncbi:MAG: YhdP family protein [Polaromonas sp.]
MPMIQSTPPLQTLASPRVKWLAAAARMALWLVLAFWLLFGASWGLLHGWIVPRIEEFRPRIELEASKALGVPVRIGLITARSEGMIPSFELRDVTLTDATGREALRLPRVLAALSPASLWGGGFEQLVIDQPVLDIRRTLDGKIYVGGLDINQAQTGNNDAADWIFSQPEFAIQGGTLRWTDEQTSAPPLALAQVDAVARNSSRRHSFRIDATPPLEWGDRFSLRGQFRQPLLAKGAGHFADWSGQLYADFSRVGDVSRIKQYVSNTFGVDPRSGSGSLRAWADISKGQPSAATLDVALRDVNVQLGKKLEPLALSSVTGRVAGKRLTDGFEFATENLRFNTPDGLQWPGGNLAMTSSGTAGQTEQKNELKADKLDLAAVAQIANRLPLGTATHALLASFAPRGLVETLDARWQIPVKGDLNYSAKGRVSGLEVAALPSQVLRSSALRATGTAATHQQPGRPGIKNAEIDFDLTQVAGKAKIVINQGHLDLPGVLEDPRVQLDKLSMDTQWKWAGDNIDIQMRDIAFAGADAEGTAQASWRSGQTRTGAPDPESLGVLDLKGVLTRGNGARVHRYLPLVLADPVRHYVRDAVVQGEVNDVKFLVKGPVDDIPYADPSKGDFKISAKVKNGTFAYVPRSIQPKDAAAWPALSDITAELVFNRAALEVNGVVARVAGLPGMQVVKADARIPNLMNAATVEVQARLKGPLNEALSFVNTSPLATLTGNALAKTIASGPADYGLRLTLPLNNIDKTKVQGSLTLPGNDAVFAPETPQLTRLRGVVTFTESGFNVPSAQARMLGGDVRFEGGMRPPGRTAAPGADLEAGTVFRAQGTATAEGIRQAKDLGLPSRLGQSATGSAAYNATLAFRRGVAEVVVTSNLQGMALGLPAPLNKTAEALLPIRFENTLLRESLAAGQKLQDQLLFSAGNIVSVQYVRDVSAAQPRVLRGSIAVGLEPGESAPTPEAGVAANIKLDNFNVDAWEKVFSSTVGSSPAAVSVAATGAAQQAQSYLPNQIAVRAKELLVGGRKLNNLVIGGTRDGPTWRANLDATELNGYLEYRQPGSTSAGRIFARLSRLNLAQSTASDVENILDSQPASIPALDIVVDDLELRGKKLGRIEVDAVNRAGSTNDSGAREWRLNKFNVIMPEAVLTATGNWVAINAQTPSASPRVPRPAERRRTVMNFRLDIADSGLLLKRFGMADVVRRGKGKMEGSVAWAGSPLGLDYPSMSGQFNVNIESGQFLKADPGLAKLLGVLSLQSLPRRLTLDFRDVFSEGFAFDFVRGDVGISQGVASTNNLQMKGVNAAVLMEGSADIAKETQDLKVVVIPEINAGTASLIAAVINPAIGLGTFLAQYFLRRPLMEAATQQFHIDGSWADPKVTKVEKKP